MHLRLLALPALCLAGAAVLFAPLRPLRAFSKIGGSLDENQRDFRVFDNFLDATANDNVTPASQFPGWTGAELALWKGPIEWGSMLHGDGTGDPVGNNPLGSGGANFDAMWAGSASGIGNTNGNIISSLANCGGGGTLAFTETPISDGWRMRFCDEWNWDDGPGNIPPGPPELFDMQAVVTHEYGHALGLGHSAVPGATMAPAIGSGQESARSIAADDIAGVQCIYGVRSATKPIITATVGDTGAGTLTIFGSNFAPTGNEVWLTSGTATATGADPIVRVPGVSSSAGGTVLAIAIPAAAGPGDAIVKIPGTGGATISNAFPTDLAGTFGTPTFHPDLLTVTPATVEALVPGTAQTVTLGGTHLDLVTSVKLDGVAIPAQRWTIVDASTITLDMPQAIALGSFSLAVSDGVGHAEQPVTIVAVSSPKLEWGTGDAANPVDHDLGLDMLVAGTPGELQLVRGSPSGAPTLGHFLLLAPGDPAAVLVNAGAYVIPAAGWLGVHLAPLPDPALVGSTWFAKSFAITRPRPFQESNLQTITLVP